MALSADTQSMSGKKLFSAACERNRGPILEVLRPRLHRQEAKQNVLELAAGSGQHAGYLAARLSDVVARWHPTDLGMSEEKQASIAAWALEESAAAGAPNIVQEGRELDARSDRWWDGWMDAGISHLFVANMTHISPWASTVGLLRGAAAILPPRGLLFIYGPFNVEGRFTSESNALFDQSLRARDAAWGIRDMDAEVGAEAAKVGLALTEKIDMPANNFTLVFKK